MDISVVIAAYNEEKTIAGVIRAAQNAGRVKEIIVVNDGSTDRTAEKVREFKEKVLLLDYEANRGKGSALYKGIEKARFPVIITLDADLIGLKPTHIDKLVEPLERNEADLVLATINILRTEEKQYPKLIENYLSWICNNHLILITGQRAARRKDFLKIKDMKEFGYGADILITDYFLTKGKEIKKLAFEDVRQYRKGEKWGRKLGSEKHLEELKDFAKVFNRLKARPKLWKEVLISPENGKTVLPSEN